MGTVEDAIQAAELIDDRIGKAADTTQKAQEATRALREALADTQQATRALAALEARIEALTEESVQTRIEKVVSEQLEELGKQTEASMRRTSTKVMSEFDKLRDTLLGLDDGNKTIPQMIEEMQLALQLKWEVFITAIKAAQATLRGCSDENCTKGSKWAVLAMIELPDGRRREGHFHLCTHHKEEMKKDSAVTILRTFQLETTVCPYQHEIEHMHETVEE